MVSASVSSCRGGPPGPPIVGPWDPDWDIPGGGDTKWEEFLRDLAAGIVGEATYNLIESLFSTPYAGTIYRAVSVCETDADGEPISEAVEVPIPPASAPEAQLTRLDAIVELLQAHKNFKQPTCELPPHYPLISSHAMALELRHPWIQNN